MINTITYSKIQEYVEHKRPFLCFFNNQILQECMRWNIHLTTPEEYKEYCKAHEERQALKFLDIVRDAKIIRCEKVANSKNTWAFLSFNKELIYSTERNNVKNAWQDFIKYVWYNKGFKEVRIAIYMLIHDIYNTKQEQEPNEQSDNQLGEAESTTEQSELQD